MNALPTRLVAILGFLRTALYAHAFRDVPRIPLFMLLHNRLVRLGQRVETLFARWQAGTLAKPRAPRPGRLPRPRRNLPYIPQGRAWLLTLPEITRLDVVVARHRLELLLAEAQFPDFLQAVPQATRLLRPLCHMLGIDRAALPPPTRRADRAAVPPPAKPRTPRRGKGAPTPPLRPIYPIGCRPLPFGKPA